MFKLYTIFDAISLLIIYRLSFYPRWKNYKYTFFVKTVFYIYICFLLYFTLLPVVIPTPFSGTNFSFNNLNLIPFKDIIQGNGHAIKEFGLNILMMVPFGVLLPFCSHKKCIPTLFYTFLLSSCIEVLQLFSIRGLAVCDITDLISNSLGGLIGYILFKIFSQKAELVITHFFPKDNKNSNKKNIKFSKLEILIYIIIFVQLFFRSIIINFIAL